MRARIARTRDGEFRYKRTTGTIQEVLELARADGYLSAYLPDKSPNRRKSWTWSGEWIEGRDTDMWEPMKPDYIKADLAEIRALHESVKGNPVLDRILSTLIGDYERRLKKVT
jgi:hypothetical protein